MNARTVISSFSLTVFFILSALPVSTCSSRRQPKWSLVHDDPLVHAANAGPIMFDRAGNGWVLTWAGLSKVENGGRTWIPVLSTKDGDRGFYSFSFAGPTTGIVVGTQKKEELHTVLILQTFDGGKSWEERTTDVLPQSDRHKAPALNSIALCGTAGWAVGNDLILHTTDGGHTWTSQHAQLSEARLLSVACTGIDSALAVGTDGFAIRTVDGGKSWIRSDTGSHQLLVQVRFFGNTGWIVGGEAGTPLLLETHDGGERWQTRELHVHAALFDVFFVDQFGWIVGENGTILASNDGGQTWSSQPSPTKANLTSLFFSSATQGWASGDNLTLLRFSE